MATKRRGNGEGSIFQRSDGKWCATLNIGYNANGKRQRRTVYGKTKREVQQKLTRLQNQKLDGKLGDATKVTVAQYLARWLQDSVRTRSAGTTYARYKGIVTNHINKHVGGVKLASLTPAHIQGMYAAMERDGASLSAREYAHAVIRRALNVALRLGLVARNACSSVDAPKSQSREIQPLTPKQAQQLLKQAEGNRLQALFVLTVTTGIRQGELFALHWEDIDLENGTIAVRHTLEEISGKLRLKEPKSSSGRRNVDLPQLAVKALWDHKARMLAEGHAGSGWVFCDTNGGPLRKSNFERRVWKPMRLAAELPPIRFHDLRHTAATLLLVEGVHPKIVQERLGHSKITTTLDIYSHVLPGMQKEAAGKLDRLLSAAGA
jgi:integrase